MMHGDEKKRWEKVQKEHVVCEELFGCKDGMGFSNIWERRDERLGDYSEEDIERIRMLSREYWFYGHSWNRHSWSRSYWPVSSVEGLMKEMSDYREFFEPQIKCLMKELEAVCEGEE